MEIKSKFSCALPDDVNVAEFIFEFFDKYGDQEAVVSLLI